MLCSVASQIYPSIMTICVRRRICDREIARHAHAGMNFDIIQFELGATQCSATCPGTNISLAAELAQGPSRNIQAA